MPVFNFFGTPAAASAAPATATSTTTAADEGADKHATAADTTTFPVTAPATDASATTAAATTAAPAPTPITSFSQLTASLNAGTWECPTCSIRNKDSQLICAACETPKPSTGTATDTATAEKKDTGTITSAGFSFPTVNFGSSTTAPTFGSAGVQFNYNNLFGGGGGSSSTTVADGAASAGSTNSSTIPSWSLPPSTGTDGSATSWFTVPGMSSTLSSFSQVAANSSTSSIASFTAPSSSSIAAGSTATDSSVSEQFKDKKAESSGEETDEIKWRGQTKVFVMKKVTLGGESKLVRDEDDEDGGSTAATGERKEEKAEEAKEEGKAGEVVDRWIDVGTGELHINRYVTDGGQHRARLIMRADKTHRLVLNVPLLASLAGTFQLQADKYVRLASVNVDEGANKVVQYLLRVKGKAEAQTVLDTLKTVTDSVKAAEKALSG